MDLDSCGNDDNFIYDEIASFMPQSGDYSLDDIDEILRSTASQLDSSIDLSSFVPHNVRDFEMPMHDDTQCQQQLVSSAALAPSSLLPGDVEFNFSMPAFLSPGATTNQSYSSDRTSSTSSMDEDHFNPEEFMSFLNDDDIKIEDFTRDTIIQNMPQRNTPSPTGSCTSSSGSSTSGVQSDASSVGSMSQTYSETQAVCVVKQEMENEFVNTNTMSMMTPIQQQPTLMQSNATAATTALPVSTHVLAAATAPTIPHPVLQSTIIPIKTMPLTNGLTTVGGGIKMPTPIKIEPKLAPKSLLQPTVKVVTPPSTTTTATNASKITPPPNSKPKTIFLSSNDFKALMQKMNTNGKGAKISGGINGQVPKIIMKTSNGKVITTTTAATNSSRVSKIVVPSNSSNNTNTQNVVPKILKTTGPLVIKQHPTKLATSTANTTALCASRGSSISPTAAVAVAHSNLSIYKGMVDERMFKKQQRMIKNRESASLSRKKKKEYVVSLESRINDLEKENYTLKGDNTSLRSQLVALAQTCQCKNSNISEFVLNSLNIPTKTGGGGSSGEHHHHHHHPVKIAPKPASRSIKQRMLAANVKKNVAVLFAMAFMVTLNVSNFQTYLNKNSIENSIEAAEEPVANAAAAGRRLLWVETETEFNEKLNGSKRETELEVPPLHFIHPVNNNRTASRGVNATAAMQHLLRDGTNANEPPLMTSKCNGGSSQPSSNQTENLRLLSNLHKWIDGNDYLNLSLHDKYGNELEKPPVHFKLTPDYFELKSIDLPLQGSVPRGKRKIYIERPQYESKQVKLEATATKADDNNGNVNGNGKHSLDLFKPKLSDEYLRLFKGIKRQDDTFYVLSFNMDHILLPASAYNKSARPKMSLMLPAGDPSLNGDIVLMQIDCEVMNTTELQLKSYMIPEKLRPIKYGATPNPNDVANNETGTREKPRENMPEKSDDELKVKSVPRTYFMMGPKTQAAAALKRKATIVKLSDSESVEDNDSAATTSSTNTINVKNSTLFTKMRETVGVNFKYD